MSSRSARSSQESAAWTLASSEPVCARCGNAKPTSSAEPCCAATGPTSPATAMFESSVGRVDKSHPQLRSSAAVSRVRTSVRLDVVPGLQASNQDYGRSSPASFATFDPATSSWRTSQDSLFEASTPFSQTWPMSGMTRNGTAFRQRPSALPTYEAASFFWPTPVADDTGHRRKPFAQGGVSLSHVLGGRANPDWIDWLMGFPVGWSSPGDSDAAPSATASFPKSQSTSDGAS
jgi:hypothetical protein